MRGELRRIQVQNLIDNGKLLIGDGYRAKNNELSTYGLPFARAGNINNGFHFKDTDRFPHESIHRVGTKISQAGDVVFTSKGTVGRFALVRPDTERFVYSPQLCFWRSLDRGFIDPRFLYYWMHSREFYVQCKSVSGQTDMAEYVSLSDQRRMHISLPPLAQQRAIAHILGTLDDKIELNRRMNETLEAMARALFKSWFVDFDPVRAKAEGRTPSGMDAETAKLFPSEFVDSELEPIPKGWSLRAVGELAVLSGGKQLERELIFGSGTIPVFGGAGIMGFTAGHNADGFVISVGRVGAYCGQFFAHRGKAWINNNASLIRPNDEQIAEWMFIALKHADIDVIKKGAAQPFVSNGDIANLKLLWPGEPTVAAFSSQLVPLLDAKARNDAESTTLARIRDDLLPRLLSGELSADAAEREVEAVA